MGELERFLHTEHPGVDPLLRAGMAHLQFETVHPFLDGNGRVGRLLITLLLNHDGLLRHPLLYLSLYFKQNRMEYYDLLDIVRRTGDWEAWLRFFLEGVAQTAEAAVATAESLLALFDQDEAQIQAQGRRAGSALRVHQAMKERPHHIPARCRRPHRPDTSNRRRRNAGATRIGNRYGTHGSSS